MSTIDTLVSKFSILVDLQQVLVGGMTSNTKMYYIIKYFICVPLTQACGLLVLGIIILGVCLTVILYELTNPATSM